ncbi:glycosyltransferase family 4 protein [Donghicola eburneus]|uniref:glycosyltransferase family 4 protein n=1 Tax=Donghicola eburneus TaxID=393278 RepID=UPI0008F0E8AA|nr:glycosyltransferase family 4 protein [Donghicola eburneus]SFQ78712.1 Glycosyltransferase involved in cell wall bisynthesis [Donghicola eburneus]
MTSKQKPILVLVYQTNPFVEGQGGGVRYVKQLALAIEGKGGRLFFFGAGGKAETRGNIRYIPVANSTDNTLVFMLKCLWARWRYIGAQDAVVHVHRLYFAMPFLGRSIKCIATLHGRTFTVFPERFGLSLSRIVFPFFKFIEGWLLSRVDQIVAVSADVQEQFQTRHGARMRSRKISIIPSMVDLSAFGPKESHYFTELMDNKPVCLFIGRLASVKNLPLLLDTWKIVIQHKPDTRLVIAGDGELREQLQQTIEQMGLSESVAMLGQVSPSSIVDAISDAKVLLLTSHHEASPTVVKEALSCGIPVVSTPVGDVASVIDDGRTGRIVAPEAEKFAEAIMDVLGWDTQKSEIASAARPVLASCAPEHVADAYIAIYNQLGFEIKSDQ